MVAVAGLVPVLVNVTVHDVGLHGLRVAVRLWQLSTGGTTNGAQGPAPNVLWFNDPVIVPPLVGQLAVVV
jgi:hypothetical protein